MYAGGKCFDTIETFKTRRFNQNLAYVKNPNRLFRVSGKVCCDGFMLNQSTGLCQTKCFKEFFLN